MASSQFGFLVVHGMHREDTSLLYRGFAGLVVLMFVFVAVARPAMWLPSENLEYRGSTRTVYVLSETNTDLVVFSPDDRAVERWAAKDVAARQFCIGPRQASIAEGLFGRPRGVAACVDRG